MAANAQPEFHALDEVMARPARFDSCAGGRGERRPLNQWRKGPSTLGSSPAAPMTIGGRGTDAA
jgi:hypothetical protein